MDDNLPADPRTIDRALGEAGRAALVDIAWVAVERATSGARRPPRGAGQAGPQLPLFGAFVTLNRDGDLRGCIGMVGQVGPAAALVAEAAWSAAVSDPRFPPVTPEELGRLELEVSLLTPLEWLDARDLPGAVVPGTHGLVVEQGPHRGLLLPQVATDQGWDAPRFLDETCRKAGLPRDAWRTGAQVGRFAALVIPGGHHA